tara:strand:- start:9334 stop:9552 length:219 start_codon:yes stop_codon:yes gene_type:complete
MNWLMEKLFGKDQHRVYIEIRRTPEQEVMFQEQKRIQDALGMEHGDDTQNWLRLHQIMLDHEKRLIALDSKI